MLAHKVIAACGTTPENVAKLLIIKVSDLANQTGLSFRPNNICCCAMLPIQKFFSLSGFLLKSGSWQLTI
jgi:hypothetical protein